MIRGGVDRASRLIDLASIALLLGGGALFGIAYLGMQRVKNAPEVDFTPGMQIYALYNEYLRMQRLSYLGLALAILGLGVGILAAMRARRLARASALVSKEQ